MIKDKKDQIVYLLFFASMGLVISLVIWAGNFRLRAPEIPGEKPVNFSEGWTVAAGGKEAVPVSLPYTAETATDEVYEFRNILPGLTSEGAALCFHSFFSSVQVLVDGQLLYEYDSASRRPFGKAAYSRWNLVKIPVRYGGGEVTIRLQSPYTRYSGEMTSVWIGDRLELTGYLVGKYLPQILICGAFLLLGAGLIVSSFILKKMLNDVCTLRCLGIFVVMSALWMMSEADFPDILWDISFLTYMTRYMLVMVCPLPYLMYLLHRFPKQYSPCFRAMAVIFSLNFLVLTVLQILDAADFVETIWVTHLWMVALFFCMAVILFKRWRLERPADVDFVLECVGVLFLAACILVEIYLYHRKEYMHNGDYLRLGLFVYIGCLFTALLLDILKKREEAEKAGQELQESRLRLMISQIQPHFIYNTLSSIRTLIRLNPDQAYSLVYDFSKYLRANIDSIGQEGTIPFDRELEHVKSYCRIEQIRFGEKLAVLYEIKEDQFQVPPLTIQPLVENAIKHGVRGKGGSGIVKIRSYKKEQEYVVEVLDDGAGFEVDSERPAGSAGLENIRIRLKEIADSTLEIVSIPGKGTKAVVTVPAEKPVNGLPVMKGK